MSWEPSQCGLDPVCARSADTLVFVDVDGVLNVGARDEGDAPVLLNKEGIADATRLWGKHENHPMCDTIERLVSVSRRKLTHGENSTFSKFACRGNSELSDLLVCRLTEVIKAAGDHRMLVLSSKWKRYKARVKRLEKAISVHLRSSFVFDAMTALENDCTPGTRLQAIGDFVEGLCTWRGSSAPTPRILVLEDFHITAMDGWLCDEVPMDSTAAAEEYLWARAGVPEATVRLVHTYEEWRSPGGLRVQVGAGLTKEHFCAAMQFLGHGCDLCAQPPDAEATSAVGDLQTLGRADAAKTGAMQQRRRPAVDLDAEDSTQRPPKLQRTAPKPGSGARGVCVLAA
mmetsp:Transcript_4/g.6  ORF Transcript_4/g.6 Transcript_4/m.6 type:complete len:343 (+) Transcript_4:91-1119(+)